MRDAVRYRHVIFDFDGVICDSLERAINHFNSLRRERFPQLPEVRNRSDMTVAYCGSLRTCLHPWLSPDNAKLFFDLHSKRMATEAKSLSTFGGIAAVLNSLDHLGYSLVTSAYSDAVNEILRRDMELSRAGLYQIAGRELRKPKSEKIHRIIESLGLATDQAIYVGDLESDILYCRDLPMDIIAVGYGYHPTWYLAKHNPTYVVGSIDELGELLNAVCWFDTEVQDT